MGMINVVPPKHLDITFTSDCNLRCTYCAVSEPGYTGEHLTIEAISEIYRFVEVNKIETIQLSGHGETTMIDDWTNIVSPFLDKARCSIISNFSRPFSENEIDTLLKLDQIMISEKWLGLSEQVFPD